MATQIHLAQRIHAHFLGAFQLTTNYALNGKKALELLMCVIIPII